ncbi:hypothetical protein EJB05_56092 [Eragrostis curvula]|uniref:Uncharacterized protein n=1 Tax=Eragrostis curvula TaxID=38414 RepID=A0A5J9SIU0_9POAL|nr:hypothetical protein EJB05_56092 [Eragrostis curvula]
MDRGGVNGRRRGSALRRGCERGGGGRVRLRGVVHLRGLAGGAGNNNFIPTLSRANMTPNGIDFAASGGIAHRPVHQRQTIADIIGEMLGQGGLLAAVLGPNTTGGSILNGVNYASCGAGILNERDGKKIFVNRIGDGPPRVTTSTSPEAAGRPLGTVTRAREFLRRSHLLVTIGSQRLPQQTT